MRTGSHLNARFKGRYGVEYAWFAVADSLPLLSMSGERAARQILAASRRGQPHLTLGFPARAAVIANALFPNVTAHAAEAVNRALPRAHPSGDPTDRSGRESRPALLPSGLTGLADAASLRNNELGRGAVT
jgi:hypothetical protein